MQDMKPKNNEKLNRRYDVRRETKSLVFTAMFSALICACSIISIPFGAVPVTLQTFAVCFSAALLGCRRGTLAVLIYIILGAVGLPVFSGMTGGFGVISGPTGGYIIGFLPTACIVGFAAEKFGHRMITLIHWMTMGIIVCYALGTAWFMFVTGNDLWVSLGYCVLPFLIPDAIKFTAAALLVNRLDKVIKL